MRALTLPQPIPECVLRHGQRVLRMAEAPSREVLGERIALHAAEAIEPYHPTHRFAMGPYVRLEIPLGLPRSAVVATARVVGVFEARSGAAGGREWSGWARTSVSREAAEAALASKWWSLGDKKSPIDTRDAAAVARGETFIAGAVRAFGWMLDEVVEIDPPAQTVRPFRNRVDVDETWELGRVAVAEVSMREGRALDERAQSENAT